MGHNGENLFQLSQRKKGKKDRVRFKPEVPKKEKIKLQAKLKIENGEALGKKLLSGMNRKIKWREEIEGLKTQIRELKEANEAINEQKKDLKENEQRFLKGYVDALKENEKLKGDIDLLKKELCRLKGEKRSEEFEDFRERKRKFEPEYF